MSIADKLTTIAENVPKVYEQGDAVGFGRGYGVGYEDGRRDGTNSVPIYHCGTLANTFLNVLFPVENFDFIMKVKKAVSVTGMFQSTANLKTNLRSIKLIAEEKDTAVSFESFCFYRHSVESVDLTEYTRKVKNASRMFYQCYILKSIYGALDFSECTNTFQWLNAARALEDVEFVPNTINISISFLQSSKLTKASLESIINGLNGEVTEQTLTLSKTAVNNAFGINVDDETTWTDEWMALRVSKSNWTFDFA